MTIDQMLAKAALEESNLRLGFSSSDRDLAHEADMARLRREQLAAEDFDGDELDFGEDPWF